MWHPPLRKVAILAATIVFALKLGEDAWGARSRSELVLHRLEVALGGPPRGQDPVLGNPRTLISEARLRFARGHGYRSVGRDSDSRAQFRAALQSALGYAWVAPRGDCLPESLVLLAKSFQALEGVGSRSAARVLDICDDLFPHTVWGEIAHRMRREIPQWSPQRSDEEWSFSGSRKL